MVGVALTQLERPGAPVILGNFLSSTSLRSGSPTFGTPEPALGSLVIGQLTRRLGVPLRCSGAFTASKAADAQAMQESAVSMLAAIQCGAHFILHSAGWLEGGLVMSYEKFVMDAISAPPCMSISAAFRSMTTRWRSTPFARWTRQALLRCAHTLKNYETAFWDSAIADNNSFEQWRDAGEKTATQRASEKCRAMLRAYEAPPIDPAVDEALQDFIARKKQAVGDMWH